MISIFAPLRYLAAVPALALIGTLAPRPGGAFSLGVRATYVRSRTDKQCRLACTMGLSTFDIYLMDPTWDE